MKFETRLTSEQIKLRLLSKISSDFDFWDDAVSRGIEINSRLQQIDIIIKYPNATIFNVLIASDEFEEISTYDLFILLFALRHPEQWLSYPEEPEEFIGAIETSKNLRQELLKITKLIENNTISLKLVINLIIYVVTKNCDRVIFSTLNENEDFFENLEDTTEDWVLTFFDRAPRKRSGKQHPIITKWINDFGD